MKQIYDVDVSFLVMAYNHEKYIKECIDSILNQELKINFEIIIGEDCSKDNTYKILKEYQNLHKDTIRLITYHSNVGAKENFRNILKLSRGKYISICEGDDYFLIQKKQSNHIKLWSKNLIFPFFLGQLILYVKIK